jgi:hypothetical protein
LHRYGQILIVLSFAVLSCSLSAQTLTIRLLNAKSGKPIKEQSVTLEWAKDTQHANEFPNSDITVDKEGVGHVEVPSGASGFSLLPGDKAGKTPGRFAYFNCNDAGLILVEEVIQIGVVPKNGCGTMNVPRQKGQVVFWAVPNSFLPSFP